MKDAVNYVVTNANLLHQAHVVDFVDLPNSQQQNNFVQACREIIVET